MTRPMNDQGQGRKPLKEGVESVIVPIRMLPEHRDTFKLLGGAEWLRKLLDKEAKKRKAIDKAKEPKS